MIFTHSYSSIPSFGKLLCIHSIIIFLNTNCSQEYGFLLYSPVEVPIVRAENFLRLKMGSFIHTNGASIYPIGEMSVISRSPSVINKHTLVGEKSCIPPIVV